VNLARYLDESRIDLDLDAVFSEEPEPRYEAVVEHMVGLLAQSEDVVNARKMRTDLINRERRTPSLLGSGVALPHVRTLQARRLVMAVGVSHAGLGLDLEAPDEIPLRIFIALVGPTYDDKAYLAVYRVLGERLQQADRLEEIARSEAPGEVVRALARH
jgi:mannitol/fructose-specific phosphotransferase system IIA component (Ntr-type)